MTPPLRPTNRRNCENFMAWNRRPPLSLEVFISHLPTDKFSKYWTSYHPRHLFVIEIKAPRSISSLPTLQRLYKDKKNPLNNLQPYLLSFRFGDHVYPSLGIAYLYLDTTSYITLYISPGMLFILKFSIYLALTP